ncbi:hypothetical protein BH10PSE1_BH10PSE1_25180 [soil metagenome]
MTLRKTLLQYDAGVSLARVEELKPNGFVTASRLELAPSGGGAALVFVDLRIATRAFHAEVARHRRGQAGVD